jgi:hypothetical protein
LPPPIAAKVPFPLLEGTSAPRPALRSIWKKNKMWYDSQLKR